MTFSLTSYTDDEKLEIAKQYLLPRQMKEHGITKRSLRLGDEAIRAVARLSPGQPVDYAHRIPVQHRRQIPAGA